MDISLKLLGKKTFRGKYIADTSLYLYNEFNNGVDPNIKAQLCQLADLNLTVHP